MPYRGTVSPAQPEASSRVDDVIAGNMATAATQLATAMDALVLRAMQASPAPAPARAASAAPAPEAVRQTAAGTNVADDAAPANRSFSWVAVNASMAQKTDTNVCKDVCFDNSESCDLNFNNIGSVCKSGQLIGAWLNISALCSDH